MALSADPKVRARQIATIQRVRGPQPKRGTDFPKRCAATAKSTGERCGAYAAPGRRVCRFHGARAGRPRKDGAPPVTRRQPPPTPERIEAMKLAAKRRLSRMRRDELAKGSSIIMLPSSEDRHAAWVIYERLCAAAGGEFRSPFAMRIAQALASRHVQGRYRDWRAFKAEVEAALGVYL